MVAQKFIKQSESMDAFQKESIINFLQNDTDIVIGTRVYVKMTKQHKYKHLASFQKPKKKK